jgi:DNA-binding MarR family transcriptional regulator
VRAFGLHQPDRTPCGQPVPISEAHAVGELARDGQLTQTALAGRLRLEKSTVSRLVAQLIGRGWVRRVQRDGDARLVWLELTPDGSRAAGELAAARAARFADLLRNIPAGRRTAVIDALTTLVEAVADQHRPVGASRVTRD